MSKFRSIKSSVTTSRQPSGLMGDRREESEHDVLLASSTSSPAHIEKTIDGTPSESQPATGKANTVENPTAETDSKIDVEPTQGESQAHETEGEPEPQPQPQPEPEPQPAPGIDGEGEEERGVEEVGEGGDKGEGEGREVLEGGDDGEGEGEEGEGEVKEGEGKEAGEEDQSDVEANGATI
eukprot:1359759-Amorphochlora_amoeboformis.AAC.1